MYDTSSLRFWEQQDKISPWASLHFALIESALVASAKGKTPEPVMPIELLAK